MQNPETSKNKHYKLIPGLHIQWPWSQLIVNGTKSIETRGYALLDKYINCELAIVETAGKYGLKKAGITQARIVGTIVFSNCFEYKSKKQWENDFDKHKVSISDKQFRFGTRKQTWGWNIKSVNKFEHNLPPPQKRGIVFILNCRVP